MNNQTNATTTTELNDELQSVYNETRLVCNDNRFVGKEFIGLRLSKEVQCSTLRGVDLSGCSFVGCNFVGVDLENAKFVGAKFIGCEFERCNLSMSQGQGSRWFRSFVYDCTLKDSRFAGTAMYYVQLKNSCISGMELTGANMSHNAGLPDVGKRANDRAESVFDGL